MLRCSRAISGGFVNLSGGWLVLNHVVMFTGVGMEATMVAQGWQSPPGGVDYRTAITEAGESTVTTPPADTTDLITPSAATLEVDRSRAEILPPSESRFPRTEAGSSGAGSPGTSGQDQFLANGHPDITPLVREVPVSEVIQKTQEAVSASKAGQRSPRGHDLHLHSDEPLILKHISALRQTDKTKTDTDECEIVPYEQMQSVDEEQAKQDEERVKLLRDLDRDLDRELSVRFTDEEVMPLLDVGTHDDVAVAFGARVAPGRSVAMETRPTTLETKDISHKTELPPEEKVVKTPDTPIETLDFPPSQTDLNVAVSRSDEAVMRSLPVASTMAASDAFLQQEQEVVLAGEDARMFAAGSAQLETSPELRTSIPEQSGIQQFKPDTLPASDILKSQEPSVTMDTDISETHPDAITSPPSAELFLPMDSTTLQSSVLEDKALIQQTDVTFQGDVRLRDEVIKPEIGHEISPVDLEMKAEGAILEETAAVDTSISHRLEEGDIRFQSTIAQQPPVGLEGQIITQQGQIPDELQADEHGKLKVLDAKDQVAPIQKIEDEMEISEISADAVKIDEEGRISATLEKRQVQFEEPKMAVPQEELIVDVPEVPDVHEEEPKVTVTEEELIVEVPKALADLERRIQPEAPVGVVSQDGLQLPMPRVLDAKEPVAPATSISKEELKLSETVPELLQVEAAGETKPQEVELKAPEVPELVVCEGLQIGTPEPVPVVEGVKVEAPIVAAPGEESKLETPSMLQEGIQEKAPSLLLEAQKLPTAIGELEVEAPLVTLPDKEITTEAPVAAVEGIKLEAPEISELDAEAASLVIPEEGVMPEASETPELVTAPEGVQPEVPGIPDIAVCEGRTLEATEPVTATDGLELKKQEEEEMKLEGSEAPEMAVLDKEVKLDIADGAVSETELTVPQELEKLEDTATATATPEEELQPEEMPIADVPKEESQIETPEVFGETMELPESRKDETEAAYIETAKEIVDSAVDKAKEKFAEEQAAVEPLIVHGSAAEVERKPEPETQEVQPEFTDIATPGSAEMEMLNVQFLSGIDAVHDDNALISEILGEDTAAATAERPEDLVAKPETQPITQEEDILSQEAPKPTEVGIAGPQELLMEDFPTGETPKVEEALISKPDEQKADDTVVQQLTEEAVDIVEDTEPEKIEKPPEKLEVQKPEHIEEPKPEKAETLDAEIPEVPKPEAVETVKSEEIEVPRTEQYEAQKQVEEVQETKIPKMEETDGLKPKETGAPEEELAGVPPADGEQAPKPEEVEILGETEMEMQAMQVAQEPMKDTDVQVSRREELPAQDTRAKELSEHGLWQEELLEQDTKPEELPTKEPRPEELHEQKTRSEALPEQETRPEELHEQEPRSEELLEQKTRPEELPEQEPKPEELLEQETRPEALPEQEIRPEELPGPETRPEELPEQETRPEELPEHEITSEELPEQEPRPEELTEQETKPEGLPEQETRPEELPEEEPRPQELLAQEPRPEELTEQEIRPEELPEEEPRPEELPEHEPWPEKLTEQETRPEESPEQETRPEELPGKEPRPEELLAQERRPKELTEHEPRPEKLTEQGTMPEELPEQETRPEELPEQEPRPEELPEPEPRPEELLAQEPWPKELTEQETRPEELPEHETKPEELPEQETRPEELHEQETRPEELPEEPMPEELAEQETKPEELAEQEPRPEELHEQETRPEELPEEPRPEELLAQEPRPKELTEQETRPEEIPEQEEAYTQAAKEIVASAINGAKEQFIKEQAEIKETKPEEEITREVKTEFPGDKPDELIQMETVEAPKAAAVDIDRIKPEEEAEVTEEDKIPVVVKDEPEALREDEAEVAEPVREVTSDRPQEATPGGVIVKETEPAAPSVTVVEAQQSEVSALSEEKVPEDDTPKEPTDGDVGAETADVVVPEKTEEPTEDKLREVSPSEPSGEIVEETVPLTKVEETLVEDKQSKPEATTVPESQEFVEEIKPMDKTDQWELAAEDDARAEPELKPEEPVPAKPQKQETETKPEEEQVLETETKPEVEQEPKKETKPEEETKLETETKPEGEQLDTETKPEKEQQPETETKPQEAKGK